MGVITNIVDAESTFNLGNIGIKDHDLLDGLNDDDHIQYLLTNGARPLIGILLLSGTKGIKGYEAGPIYIAPFSDISRAFEIRKSDNLTPMMSFDMATDDVGFGTTTPQEPIHVLRTENNNQGILIENSVGGTAAVVRFICKSDLGSFFLASYSSTFITSGAKKQNGGILTSSNNASGGLSIVARAASSEIRFYAGGNTDSHEHLTISPNNIAIRSGFPLYFDGLTRSKSLKWNSSQFEFNDILAIPLDNKALILGAGLDMSIYYTGIVGYLDTSLIAPSDLQINCGSNKTIELVETVWEDLRIVPGAFVFAGASNPSLQNWQPGGAGATFKVYKFLKNDEVFASCQMPHSYKEGTDLEFHLHWTPADRGNEENGNSVGWKVDYTIADPNDDFSSSLTVDLQDVCSGVDDRHELTSSVTISGVGLKISHIIELRIYRSDTGTDDTWVGITAALSPALLEFDIHYEINTLGSRQQLIK